MFGNAQTQTGDSSTGSAGTRTAAEIIGEACDRNIPVCVVRPKEAGQVPMARGRLLSIGRDGIDIDRVQVPGFKLHFKSGDDLEAYFSMGQTLFQFRTKLETIMEPKRLNRRMVIPGMTITMPRLISQGDRRNLFRVSLAARDDRPDVTIWRVLTRTDDHEEEPEPEDSVPAMPSLAFNVHGVSMEKAGELASRPPELDGVIADGTENGFGILLHGIRASRFDLFEPLLVRIAVPAVEGRDGRSGSEAQDMLALCEVRSKREVGKDGVRLGVVLIESAPGLEGRQQKDALRKYLAEVQRDFLRKNRGRAA